MTNLLMRLEYVRIETKMVENPMFLKVAKKMVGCESVAVTL